MTQAVSQAQATNAADISSGPSGLAAMLAAAEQDGTFARMSDESKLDLSLKLIGLTDDQLAQGGLTRDGILGFVFGEDAFKRPI
jgi:hypothetical protein